MLIIEWVSKAWTEFEKELPVFYLEALARLFALLRAFPQPHRNAVARRRHYCLHGPCSVHICRKSQQQRKALHLEDPRDLRSHRDRTLQTLYKAGQYLGPGPYGGLADPLSRMPRGEQFHRLELPALLAELLHRLLDSIRTAHSIRVTAEKDTHLATRIVQRWRVPKNPISNVRAIGR
jgi:hypothetical protein